LQNEQNSLQKLTGNVQQAGYQFQFIAFSFRSFGENSGPRRFAVKKVTFLQERMMKIPFP
jgi:hypothetical protein